MGRATHLLFTQMNARAQSPAGEPGSCGTHIGVRRHPREFGATEPEGSVFGAPGQGIPSLVDLRRLRNRPTSPFAVDLSQRSRSRTASSRFATCSFLRIADTCVRTVTGVMNKRSPICSV